jgi:hypothetical protein
LRGGGDTTPPPAPLFIAVDSCRRLRSRLSLFEQRQRIPIGESLNCDWLLIWPILAAMSSMMLLSLLLLLDKKRTNNKALYFLSSAVDFKAVPAHGLEGSGE